jgi:hypothetical protein
MRKLHFLVLDLDFGGGVVSQNIRSEPIGRAKLLHTPKNYKKFWLATNSLTLILLLSAKKKLSNVFTFRS